MDEKYLRPAHDGFSRISIHDLKHTFGRRLRAAGVTLEDRKALLGHKNGSITSHYSAVELDQRKGTVNTPSELICPDTPSASAKGRMRSVWQFVFGRFPPSQSDSF